jgi:hypothetical protein
MSGIECVELVQQELGKNNDCTLQYSTLPGFAVTRFYPHSSYDIELPSEDIGSIPVEKTKSKSSSISWQSDCNFMGK